MAKIVVEFNFEGVDLRIVERTDSPNSPYYVIEKKGKDAMDNVSYNEITKIFPCVYFDVFGCEIKESAFLYLVLKKISKDIEIYRKD